MDFKKTLKDIYSAWLGKNIGIRLGAPVENWTYEQIKNTYGKIDRYVCDYEPCFASDDDANGPAFFVRALDYHCSKDISCEELSQQIVNILSEGHGFFWWGGKGIATEHTAYLNLLEGMKAPMSGSAKVNGKALSEQIGGQIFSDCWGYVAYDDPKLASDLAGKMASAMHDLDGVWGARYIAACISLAFTIKDAYQVVVKGLDYIDANSTYAKLVREIIDIYDQKKTQEECLDYILKNHGYDRYEGVCHILPNTAIMIMALLYGENDFDKTMSMLCSAGWDSDCTCGNVGSIMGALVGVDKIDSKWIIPIKDRFIGSSNIGSWNIDTLSHQAYYFASLAFKLKECMVSIDSQLMHRNLYTFDLPYGIQGFECNSYRGFEASLIQKENTLTCIVNNAFPNECLKIYKKTYYRPCDLYDTRYQPSFSPIVYPNETIKFYLLPYENLQVRIYAKGRNQTYYGNWSKDCHLLLQLPKGGDLIYEVGIEIKALNRMMHEYLQIQKVSFDHQIDCLIDFRKEYMNDYGLDYGGEVFKEIN
ncbi:MAG: ADP-ribosylglycohydrolase family protein, partial [Traorella sp.]